MSIVFHDIHDAFDALTIPGSSRASFGKSKRFIRVRKVPPNRTLPMNGVMVVKTGIVNETTDKFACFPNGSEDLGPLNENRKMARN